MAQSDDDDCGRPKRELTDESLRVERDKADERDAGQLAAAEDKADRVVRLARQRADEVVQSARDTADRVRDPKVPVDQARAELVRAHADVALDHERSVADQLLEEEREQRRRYLADFLSAEREATDQDLIDERAHSDTVIAARDEFLGTVSHDIRSLLAGLSINAERLARIAPPGDDGAVLRKMAAGNQRMASRMNRLVSDLLDVASIEEGRLAVHLDQVEVGDLMRDTMDAFEPIAADKQVVLIADPHDHPMPAHLDGQRILQVLANLVSNAIKFTPIDGSVTLRVRRSGAELQFEVADTGIGIAADQLTAVFERFRQVSQDRRGHGLGLHISKHIVEQHGGRVWAQSELGVGSTFFFTIPS